jgi:putative hemolysin
LLLKDRVLSEITSKLYTIKIAHTEAEVEAALRLRYRVFNEELHRDFNFKENLDKDEYDDQSHHLIVIHNETDEIVGTYRLQTYEQAVQNNGFVSNRRFHIDQLPEDVLVNAVEVGRACISKEHRSGRVLFLLWKGFAGYLTHFNKRYLFGYAALDSKDPQVALNTFNYLQREGILHPDYQITPRKEFEINENDLTGASDEIDIPPLFQNYLDVGCNICGMPSFEKKQNLAHFLILLDIEFISDRTRKLFFG